MHRRPIFPCKLCGGLDLVLSTPDHSLEQHVQETARFPVDPWLGALPGTRHVQGTPPLATPPAPDSSEPCLIRPCNQAGPPQPDSFPLRESRSTGGASPEQYQGGVAVPYVPGRSLIVGGVRRFPQAIVPRDGTVLRPAAAWAPASDGDPGCKRGVEGRTVHAGLASGHDTRQPNRRPSRFPMDGRSRHATYGLLES